jgi:ankyrin repeat protein
LERCFEKMARGKGTKKKEKVTKKREKEEDERENEEEEEERKKQKVLGEEEQEALNKEFLDACWKKKLGNAKALVERGADVFYCDKKGKNGLHYACANEDYEAAEEIVKYLIQKQKALLRMFDSKHWSALHFAAKYSSAKICEILIDNGCDVNGRTKKLSTPLTLCCERTDDEALNVVKLLIESGADLAKKTEKGNTALHHACDKGVVEVVQFLIEAKVNLNAQNNTGRTPLIRVKKGLVAKLLIERGADLGRRPKKEVLLYIVPVRRA